jgi:hypothetical protein
LLPPPPPSSPTASADTSVSLESLLKGLPSPCKLCVLLDVCRPGAATVRLNVGDLHDGIELTSAYASPGKPGSAAGTSSTAATAFATSLIDAVKSQGATASLQELLALVRVGVQSSGQKLTLVDDGSADTIYLIEEWKRAGSSIVDVVPQPSGAGAPSGEASVEAASAESSLLQQQQEVHVFKGALQDLFEVGMILQRVVPDIEEVGADADAGIRFASGCCSVGTLGSPRVGA